jgi:hypothetical protein
LHSTEQDKNDLSISMGMANLYSLAFIIPLAIIELGLYYLIWGHGSMDLAVQAVARHFRWYVLFFLIGIIIHEAIHGVTWMVAGRKSLKTIRFGINIRALTPYAHCNEPLAIRVYRLGTLMPGLLLGIVPYLFGLLSGNGGIMLFGLLFTVAAGGDALVLWIIRKEKPERLVLDHPTRVGCLIAEESKSRKD